MTEHDHMVDTDILPIVLVCASNGFGGCSLDDPPGRYELQWVASTPSQRIVKG